MAEEFDDQELEGLLSGDVRYVTITLYSDGYVKIDYDASKISDEEVQLLLHDAVRVQQDYRFELLEEREDEEEEEDD